MVMWPKEDDIFVFIDMCMHIYLFIIHLHTLFL